jgi:hypothetical protein
LAKSSVEIARLEAITTGNSWIVVVLLSSGKIIGSVGGTKFRVWGWVNIAETSVSLLEEWLSARGYVCPRPVEILAETQ